VGYQLWLPGHQLGRGRAPWIDPYSFRPESEPRFNPAWWPFGLLFWPLVAALGPVLAWNAFVLLGFVAAGGLTTGWLRELGLPRGAALAGGLAFALAPYRVVQSADHLLAAAAVLLPAALWAWERGMRGSRAWFGVSALALASIPLSGQVHLALGALPFFAAYVLARSRGRRDLVAFSLALLLALAAGALVYFTVISGSTGAGGRSFAQVERYSAGWGDLVARRIRGEREAFVFLGWALPLLALVGLATLRRRALALVLGLGVLVPVLLALGATTPLYEPLWRALPPLEATRVPERLMPVACLALAALAAFALARVKRPLVVAAVLGLLALDLRVAALIEATAADPGNSAYVALSRLPPGRLLELPVYRPEQQGGSIYHYYLQGAPRERPTGYSTLAPPSADAVARRLRALNCGFWSDAEARLVARLGVRYVLVHVGIYERDRVFLCHPGGLARHGYRIVVDKGPIFLLALSSPE